MAKQPGQLVHLNAVRHDEREMRRAEAWTLRIEGNTVRQIAERLCCSVSTAHEYLRTTLEELKTNRDENADNWRRLQLERLDGTIADWLPISRNRQHPECARAAMIYMRAIELQAKLTGLLGSNVVLPPNGQPGLTDLNDIKQAVASSPAMLSGLKRMLDEVEAEVTKKPDPKQ